MRWWNVSVYLSGKFPITQLFVNLKSLISVYKYTYSLECLFTESRKTSLFIFYLHYALNIKNWKMFILLAMGSTIRDY